MKNLLGNDNVYKKPSLLAASKFFINSAKVLLPVGFVAFSLISWSWWGMIVVSLLITLVVWAVIVRYVVKFISARRIVKNRRYLGEIDLSNNQPDGSRIGVSTLIEEIREGKIRSKEKTLASFKAQIINQDDGWWLYDASSTIYNAKGKASGKRYYTVLEVKLRQTVPHLVFDNPKAKGGQLTAIYSGAQKLTGVLGPQIDSRFATFSPKHHTIETLSFITPEVIEAMLALPACDLEFIDNSLLCYGPLLSTNKISNFKKAGFNLHASVNDNLRLYQPPEKSVKPFGRRLLKKYRQHLVFGVGSLSLGVLIFLWIVISWVNSGPSLDDRLIWMPISLIAGIQSLQIGFKRRRQNQTTEQEFLRTQTPLN